MPDENTAPYAEYVTLMELSRLFNIKYSVLQHWINKGLNHVKIGNSILIHPDDFNTWKAAHVTESKIYKLKDI